MPEILEDSNVHCSSLRHRWNPYGSNDRSAYQAGSLGVEFPVGNQVLHGLGVVARSQRELLIQLVRFLDLSQVDVDAETGPVGDSQETVNNPKRLFRQALAVL